MTYSRISGGTKREQRINEHGFFILKEGPLMLNQFP